MCLDCLFCSARPGAAGRGATQRPAKRHLSDDHNQSKSEYGQLPNLLEQRELRNLYIKEVEHARSKYTDIKDHYKELFFKSDLCMSKVPDSNFSDVHTEATANEVLKKRGYTIGRRLGHGGYGEVFYGTNSTDVFAIKCIELMRGNGKKQEKALQKLFVEIAIMERYPHPNIATILDHFVADGICYLVMEFAPCGSLASFLSKSGRFSEQDCYEYFMQMLRGVLYLHSFCIAHRDIKLDNVLLWMPLKDSQIRVAKLTDFGLSVAVFDVKEGRMANGYYAGTRQYMAIEIIRLEAFNEFDIADHMEFNPFKADIYSMGICLYEMLCGKTPFNFARNYKRMYEAQMRCKLTYSSDISHQIKDLIAKMLEPDPDKRLDPFGIWIHPWMLYCYSNHRLHNHPQSPWVKAKYTISRVKTRIGIRAQSKSASGESSKIADSQSETLT